MKTFFKILLSLVLILSTGCSDKPKTEKVESIHKTQNLTIYTTEHGLADNFISALYVEKISDREILWIGTWKGLVKFDQERWVRFTKEDGLAQDHITDIKIDKNNKLWISTISLKQDSGISVYDGRNWKNYTTINDKHIGNIISLYVDSKNRVWAGSWGKGLLCFDGKEWKTYTKADGISSNEIMAITEYKDNLWFATKNSGAFYKNNQNDEWITITEHSSKLIHNSICSLTSSEDELWLGTWGGASRLKNDKWENFTSWNGLSDNFISTICIDEYDNTVYFGTYKGVTILKDGKFTHLTINEGLPSNKILSIANTKDSIWIGTDKGLVKYNK